MRGVKIFNRAINVIASEYFKNEVIPTSYISFRPFSILIIFLILRIFFKDR